MIKISPSVLAADLGHLADEIKRTSESGVDYVHLDIMDGHFVPNLTFGPDMVRFVNSATDLPLDVHLMISNPEEYLEIYVEAGADVLTVHFEAIDDSTKTLRTIRDLGVKSGLSISPNTPFDAAKTYISDADWLLVMSVHPGFAGQRFMAQSLKKIADARQFIDREKLRCEIAVDGGMDLTNGPRAAEAGADILAIGSSFYKSSDYAEYVRQLRQATAAIERDRQQAI
jgi:ribulose-phosphate 3-epimerase